MLRLPTIPDPLDIGIQSNHSCDLADHGSLRVEAAIELVLVDRVERDKRMFSDYLPVGFVNHLRGVVVYLNYLAKAAAVH